MIKKRQFTYSMSKNELICGFIFLPLFIFLLPLFLTLIAERINPDITNEGLNVAFHLMCFVIAFLIFRRYLKSSFSDFLDAGFNAFYSVFSGFILFYIVMYAVSFFFYTADITANKEISVFSQTVMSRKVMIAVFALLGPMVQELLFRGLVFGSIRQKHRILAYIISFLLFALYHIWDFLFISFNRELLLLLLEYLPLSIALCWSYEKTSSIWSPIFLHMLVNTYTIYMMP